ncbi:hypothetical protein FK765_25890 [Escherichia coli]|nr:hypothetical protein [Escherichia coli]
MCADRRSTVVTVNSVRIFLIVVSSSIDRNLNPQKIKKTPEKGCLFNTFRVPCEWLQQLNGFH